MNNPQEPSHEPVNTPGSPLVMEDECRQLLHALSNKILPIVVFAELAIKRCEDEQLGHQIKKIHTAAEQARDILLRLRDLQAKELEG